MNGNEMRYIQEASDVNWVVPLGPSVNGLEDDLRCFSAPVSPSDERRNFPEKEDYPQAIIAHEDNPDNPWKESLPGSKDKHIIALCSGTSAVCLALIVSGAKVSDEVIYRSFTFCVSPHPVAYLDATSVFVDSKKEIWSLDPTPLEKAVRDGIAKVGKKPEIIIVVYLCGVPTKIKEVLIVVDRYDTPVVKDAVEDLGSKYERQIRGIFDEYDVLSFNGNKVITTSGDGAPICPNEEARSNVMSHVTQVREGYPYYQHGKVGLNYRVSNVCAGIGRG